MQKLGPNSNKTRIWTLSERIRPAGLLWGFTVDKRNQFVICYDLYCVDDQHSHGKSVGKYHMVIRVKPLFIKIFKISPAMTKYFRVHIQAIMNMSPMTPQRKHLIIPQMPFIRLFSFLCIDIMQFSVLKLGSVILWNSGIL